ncbi:pyridoxal-phosphate dependent enzyme [Streptomyces purpurascens]|uniref:pyridoxal-phosphate dependent enzyme n=1 Tax=Streptomyces purpurascens TaxID=1924 RepID=UPI003C2F195A
MRKTRLDSARIRAARRVIDPVFLDTPLYRCEALEPDLGCTVSITLETANPVRSFKAWSGRGRAAVIARHDGIRLVEDSLDLETCEGAATVGLEPVDTVPSFDAVLIALGGGALATGVGQVVKALAPGVEVICVQPLGAPAMTHSWRGRRVAGMRMLLDHAGLVVEPSAALGIAAILKDRDRFAGRHVVTIVCGGNVDVDAYHRWVDAAPTHRS